MRQHTVRGAKDFKLHLVAIPSGDGAVTLATFTQRIELFLYLPQREIQGSHSLQRIIALRLDLSEVNTFNSLIHSGGLIDGVELVDRVRELEEFGGEIE